MEATSAPRPHGVRIPKPRRLLAALSDEGLVEHVRKGDSTAFEVLYDRYSQGILGFCRHMLGSAADAEDALQHTFIAAHADIQRAGKRQLHVKAWLYTVARNRCVSMLRARREQLADEPIEIVGADFSTDVQQREDLRALLADIRKLPDDQREALVLAEVGDLSHDDIASVLGCEASKVKSLVFQARTALIDRRTARETPCEEIREQLATLRGGALRRSHLRHHLEACPGCTQYREEIRRQRAMLAIALPIVPSAALKANVLGSIGLGGGTAAASAGGAGASAAGFGFAQAGVAKVAIAAAVLAGGAGTAAVAKNGGVPLLHHSAPTATSSSQHTLTKTAAGAAAGSTKPTTAAVVAKEAHAKSSTGTGSASRTKHGFTPTTGGSNGDAAKQFAATRGSGKHLGITKTHAKKAHSHKKVVKHVVTPRRKAKPAPKAHVPASTPKTTTPKSPTPAPKANTTPQPAPTPAPEPQPTATTPVPAPTGGDGGSAGKLLGGSKHAATDTTG